VRRNGGAGQVRERVRGSGALDAGTPSLTDPPILLQESRYSFSISNGHREFFRVHGSLEDERKQQKKGQPTPFSLRRSYACLYPVLPGIREKQE
jgi:hypothetical protein